MATVTSFPITTVPLSPLVGIKVAYSTTTTDSDPGAGTFRFNNATVASATAAYIDNTDNGGRTITGLLDLMDDSTSTVKGRIRFENVNDQTIWAEFQITGSVVDGTGYRKLTLQNGVSAGTLADGDEFAIQFTRSGDAAATTAAALSVYGRSANSSGAPADISTTSGTYYVLRETGGVLGFGTVSSPGIADDAVIFSKMQNIATDSLIGRDTTGTGDPENILLNSTLQMDGSGNLRRAALTGDVTAAAGSNATTIANDAVTYAKMQNTSAASVLLGRGSASGAGDPQEITLGSGLSMSGTTLSSSGVSPSVTSSSAFTAQQATVTVTIASPGVVTWTSHPFTASGAAFSLATTGAVPTGLATNTNYYVIYVDANTFRLATSVDNALAGTAINTSGSQSGTHTGYNTAYLTTTTTADINGISLGAGTWSVFASASYSGSAAGTTTVNTVVTDLGASSGSLQQVPTKFSKNNYVGTTPFASSGGFSMDAGPGIFVLGSTTTLYLKAFAVFGTSDTRVTGGIVAYRIA